MADTVRNTWVATKNAPNACYQTNAPFNGTSNTVSLLIGSLHKKSMKYNRAIITIFRQLPEFHGTTSTKS
jgi:hypothetical protein